MDQAEVVDDDNNDEPIEFEDDDLDGIVGFDDDNHILQQPSEEP